MTIHILKGDCREILKTLPDESVHCCVTSPPYFGLRDYGVDGQIGLEPTPDAYVAEMVAVFREVRGVLRKDGTLWLNIGDSYNGYMANHRGTGLEIKRQSSRKYIEPGAGLRTNTLKNKDLIGIPWLLAFALRADGWYLRQDIIWSKPNPMPESVTDRCTKAHEYLFLLSKSERYFYDAEVIAEPVTMSTIERLSQPTLDEQAGSFRVPGKTNGPMKAVGTPRHDGARWNNNNGRGFLKKSGNKKRKDATERGCPQSGVDGSIPWEGTTRNKRSVWEVTTQPFSDAHFATFPPALIEPCILAGCPKDGTVLDPFGGAGTTGMVADRLGRNSILIELNPEYAAMAERRIINDAGMFAEVVSP